MTLLELADFLEKNPDKWCQGSGGQDRDGNNVNFSNVLAVKRCLYGWVKTLDVDTRPIYDRIGDSMVRWNDAPGRTVQDVIELLRK